MGKQHIKSPPSKPNSKRAWSHTPDLASSPLAALPLAAVLLEVAARLADLPMADFDMVIAQTLDQLAIHFQMEHGQMEHGQMEHGQIEHRQIEHVELSILTPELQGDPSHAGVEQRYSTSGPDVPAANAIAFSSPWFAAQLREGHLIHLPYGSDDLPAEAETERRYLSEQGIKSSLVIPLHIGGQLLGALYFNSTTHSYTWPAQDLQALTMFARVLAGAVQRKHTEALLRRNGEELSLAHDAAGTGIGSWDLQHPARQELLRQVRMMEQTERLGQIGGWELDIANGAYYWTPETYTIFGLSPTLYSPTFETSLHFFTPASAKILQDAVRRATELGESFDLKLQVVKAQGITIWARWSGRIEMLDGCVVRLYGSIQDITLRTEIEDQLREAQKMEAVGQLAGGIAHDFNNLLTGINGMSELALIYLNRIPTTKETDRVRHYLTEIHRSGGRAADLTRQLLAFSRKQMLQPKVLDLRDNLATAKGLLHQILGENIELTLVMPSQLGLVMADPSQIEQVIINLVINAREAMPSGGTLTIKLVDMTIDEVTARHQMRLNPGSYVVLEVQDSGHGMTPEVQTRLFDPFFTTKAVGEGTGLGLATVYGIVKQSGGMIEVESQISVGSTFRIYLPQSPSGQQDPSFTTAHVRGGTETILVVDDDTWVRESFRTALEAKGYYVLDASSGRGASTLYQSYVGTIHLLVADDGMTDMSGAALANQALLFRPEMRVLLLSENGEERVSSLLPHQSERFFLDKPFRMESLLAKVRSVLDTPSSVSLHSE